MPNYRRPIATGAAVFLTARLAEPRSRLLVEEVERLREAVRRTRAERPFAVDAWVVLPDHLHCVWRLPQGDRDLGTRWRLIKSRFSMGLPRGRLRPSHLARQERGVWQRRFWEHHIRDEAEHAALVEYCWIDPVKHGHAERPEDWPYVRIRRA